MRRALFALAAVALAAAGAPALLADSSPSPAPVPLPHTTTPNIADAEHPAPILLAQRGGPGARRGGSFRRSIGSGAGFVLEDSGACTVLPFYGQSSSIGVCSGTCTVFGNPPCDIGGGDDICQRLTNSAITGAWMPSWNGGTLQYETPLIAMGPTGARNPFEVSAYGLVEQYRDMAGNPTEATLSFWAGQQGTQISDLDRGRVPYSASATNYNVDFARFVEALRVIVTDVAASPATYGCNGNVVLRGMAMVQGETDDPSPIAFVQIDTSAVTVSSGQATATVLANHGVVAGDSIYTTNLTTNDGDATTPETVISVTPTTIVYATTAGDGPMADGVGEVNLETTYAERIAFFLANLNEDVRNITGQTGTVNVSWDQTSGWAANASLRAPTAQYLLDAALADPYLHTIGSKGWYNPGDASNDFLGETSVTGVHAWETTGASPLHFSALTQQHVGAQHAKVLYRAIHLGQNWDGMRMTSCGQSGSVVTCCTNARGGLTRDTVNLPSNGHWNGDDGFELYTDEIGAPQITNVAASGSQCIAMTLSYPATDLASTRMEAGFRGLLRTSGSEPENGARDSDVLADANPGAPGWTMWRDNDDATNYGLSGALYNPLAIQSSVISGLSSLPADDVAYFGFDTNDEAVSFADDAAFPTTEGVFAFWIRSSSWVHGQDIIRKWSSGQEAIRIITLVSGGVMRPQAQIDSVSETSNPSDFTIAADGVWNHVMFIYDGSAGAGSRGRWIVNGIELATGVDSLPAAIPDTTATLYIGSDAVSSGVAEDMGDIAIFASNPTDQALAQARIFDRRNSLGSVTPSPVYFIRPDCDDDLTVSDGVTNYGSIATDGTGVNTEAEDRVITDSPACEGVDGGVPDSGAPADSGTPDAGVADTGPTDAGFPQTVANNYALECDGTTDYIQFGDQTWFDGQNEALICYTIRETTRTNVDRPIGHWVAGAYQWSMRSSNTNPLFYAPTSAAANNGYVADTDGFFVAGPHQQLCVRYDLAQATDTDKVRLWRNGVEISMEATDGNPGTVFTTPSGGGFALCGRHDGTELWAGTIDEVSIWFDANMPSDAQILNELSVNTTDSDTCAMPNYGTGGRPTAPAADVRCRLENDYVCVDADDATVVTGTAFGTPVFTSTEQSCSGTHDNYTSIQPAVADGWTTDNWIFSGDTQMVLCWTSDQSSAQANAWILNQWNNTTASSWGINYRTGTLRVWTAPTATDTDITSTYENFTMASSTGRHNYCVSWQLGEAVNGDRISVWEDCVELTGTPVGTQPSSFVFNSGESTYVGLRSTGNLGWGGGGTHELDNIAVWRDQDSGPTRAQIASTVCFDPATQDSPDYNNLSGVGAPGHWYPLDGDLEDREGNGGDLTLSAGATSWPSVATPLD